MKIYNAGLIIPGLLLFIVMVTFPFWYNKKGAASAPDPRTNTPVIEGMAEKQCILPKDEMRTRHMQILNVWRTEVVRSGNRLYEAWDGKKYNMSLQNECMRCHSNKSEFCDTCHVYVGLRSGSQPYCWTCHIAPKED